MSRTWNGQSRGFEVTCFSAWKKQDQYINPYLSHDGTCLNCDVAGSACIRLCGNLARGLFSLRVSE